MIDVSLWSGALDELLLGNEGRAILADYARRVRDGARVNARAISNKTAAITTESGVDSLGPYADVGYAKSHPGFYLWWWEVGTRNHAPVPHLRPALKPGI